MKFVISYIFSRNALQELGKYILLMLMSVLLVGMLIVEAVGQERYDGIRHKFTGEKSRFEIDLPATSQYSIIEDWEENVVSVKVRNVVDNNFDKYEIDRVRNYIVDYATVQSSNNELQIYIHTSGSFKINSFEGKNSRRLYLDIYPDTGQPDAETFHSRGQVYESRGEYTKALSQYTKALNLRPDSFAIQQKINNVTYLIGSNVPVMFGREKEQTSLHGAEDRSNDGNSAEPEIIEWEAAPDEETREDNRGDSTTNTEMSVNSAIENDENEIEQPNSSDTKNFNDSATDNGAKVTEPQTSVEFPAESGGIIGFQDLLKKSGTELYILIALYIIIGILSFVVIMLARRLFKLHRLSKKKSAAKTDSIRPNLDFGKLKTTNSKGLVSDKHIKEVRQFARQLSDLYSKSESQKRIVSPKKPVRKSSEMIPDHSRKIESIMENQNKKFYDTESIRLTRKYRDNNAKQQSSGDKYEAARQLAGQNWETWEIARELSMGTEEVNMALGLKKRNDDFNDKEEMIERMIHLSKKGLNTKDIATKLQVGDEEVRLALKMQERSNAI